MPTRAGNGIDGLWVAKLVRGPLLTAFQSRLAACNINTNAWPLGLCDTSEPTLRWPITGESQPAVVKYGMCANADDADADEELEEEEEEDGDDRAEVPFGGLRVYVLLEE
jgi:hypothetical protein